MNAMSKNGRSKYAKQANIQNDCVQQWQPVDTPIFLQGCCCCCCLKQSCKQHAEDTATVGTFSAGEAHSNKDTTGTLSRRGLFDVDLHSCNTKLLQSHQQHRADGSRHTPEQMCNQLIDTSKPCCRWVSLWTLHHALGQCGTALCSSTTGSSAEPSARMQLPDVLQPSGHQWKQHCVCCYLLLSVPLAYAAHHILQANQEMFRHRTVDFK